MQGSVANPPSVQADQLHSSRHIRAALIIVLVVLSGLVASPGSLAQSSLAPANFVTILVYNFVEVPPSTLDRAERKANQILATAGARVLWVDCLDPHLPARDGTLCQIGWTPQTPGLRLIGGVNKFQQSEFAETAIPVLSTIYYERIQRRAERDNAPYELAVLLGCVVAHELGHLLLNTPTHSASGIMQPAWGAHQIQQALTNRLHFTRAQLATIQTQVRLLTQSRIDTNLSPESFPLRKRQPSP